MGELIGPRECHLSVESGVPCTNIDYLTKLEAAVLAAQKYKECVENNTCTDEIVQELVQAIKCVSRSQ